MAETTAISWADATFNPWMGCERVSPACARCYAETLTKNRMRLDVWGSSPRKITSASTWKKPEKWDRDAEAEGKRIRVFCASLADVFEELPELDEPRERLFDLIDRTRSIDWMLLTKRPEFARDWLRAYYERTDNFGRVWTSRDGLGWGCFPNVWVGVSVENQRWTWRADVLREIPSVIRFISAEPLLESLSTPKIPKPGRETLSLDGIDWLIVGGESGSKAARPMHPDWARELRDRCSYRGIPFHFKQFGSWRPATPEDSGWIRSITADGAHVPLAACGQDGTTEMLFSGVRPDAGGNVLDGEVWDQVPGSAVLA